MDENRPMTKRELKAIRRLEKLDHAASEKRQNTIKWLIIGAASLLFLVFFGFLIFLAKQSPQVSIVLSEKGWVRGAETAKVTLIEFGDFQCPACRIYYPIVRDVLTSYEGRLRLLFKHFPLTQAHPNAYLAAKAAEAAGAQGKFFEYHDILYEKQGEWAPLPIVVARTKFISYASELKLDEEKFKKDLENKESEAKIRENQDEGINNGVSGTPTFFLNGKKIENPKGVEDFKKLIEKELK